MNLPSEFWSRFVNVDDELDADDEDPFSPAAAAAPSQGLSLNSAYCLLFQVGQGRR